MATTVETLRGMPIGKVFGLCLTTKQAQENGFRAFVRRNAADSYHLEASWVVPSSFEDNPESHTNNPFGMGVSFELIARDVETAEQAAELYDAAKKQLLARQPVRWQ